MLYVVLFFLIFSLYLYVVLGGADYGVGIVELFSSEENQKITKKLCIGLWDLFGKQITSG